ncbi:FGGY family carbohydrate kinase [Antarcticirhabdus aurantiaca]|uniref:FGGY family carbohydrate kinase n=1 Tax=Antarcticirhabdus aurantiaca TaxID=2606717 RepID=A0ACD4NMX4_9HYPH|nr:FGGY family carbohydrate kinase [Antarcticirhabdus aurantiaca]WAJ28102.1 FGGY family carbohydrate kinase [Jeongeuplla avenae]
MSAAPDLILAVDQGTSSTKCLVLDRTGAVVGQGSAMLGESCPRPGWVEQDPEAIWASVAAAVAATFAGGLDPARVAGVGFSTQRESMLLWDKATGHAVSPLLSWQDQRTKALAQDIGTPVVREAVRRISGLPLDPMFSALKARWLLDAHDPDRTRSTAGELALGTVDSWILFRLGGGHVTEIGNASRTQLLDTAAGTWSPELCEIFGVPMAALPQILPSTGPFPAIRSLAPLRDGTPVLSVMGDSHAALFGQGGFSPGTVKATFGTGSSVMGLVGSNTDRLDPGTCLTVGWQIGGEAPALAAEGNIRSAGATLRWLADLFGLSVDALVTEGLDAPAGSGVHLVPAFNGLGAPYWDDEAEGVITGFKLGTARAALARAAVESIPHQVADVVASVERTTGARVASLFADGGPSANDRLMQMMADLAGLTVLRAPVAGLSALGVAHMAGLSAGFWDIAALAATDRRHVAFRPAAPEAGRLAARTDWARAVARARLRPVAVAAGINQSASPAGNVAPLRAAG